MKEDTRGVGSRTLSAILGIRQSKRDLYDLPGDLTEANNFQTAAGMIDLYLAARDGGKREAISDVDLPITMALLKISRIAVAKDHHDNYCDAANYLILAGDRQTERSERKERRVDFADALQYAFKGGVVGSLHTKRDGLGPRIPVGAASPPRRLPPSLTRDHDIDLIIADIESDLGLLGAELDDSYLKNILSAVVSWKKMRAREAAARVDPAGPFPKYEDEESAEDQGELRLTTSGPITEADFGAMLHPYGRNSTVDRLNEMAGVTEDGGPAPDTRTPEQCRDDNAETTTQRKWRKSKL